MMYTVVLGFARLLTKFIWSLRVYGRENVPKQGPLIVAANHIHWMDPVALAIAIPRTVRFMAKQELFKNPAFGCFVRSLGAFPVKRGEPDRSAIRTSLEVLRDGGVLGLFPEGTRSRTGDLKEAEPGVAVLAVRGKAPVLPVGISCTAAFPKGVTVNIGRPMRFEQFYDQKAKMSTYRDIGREIMKEISRLREGANDTV